MLNKGYEKQTRLLLDVLPEVMKEPCFALHGGTAINLFIRDMPRLSVDIDLTYLPIEDRETSLRNIYQALERIKSRIESVFPSVQVQHKKEIAKLFIASQEATIKLEVNLVARGLLKEPEQILLCDRAQSQFEASATASVVSPGQLYGGKICAALDRQHPRDLYDVKFLLENEGFLEEVKRGFILCLLGSVRPINEIIKPTLQNQRALMENHFSGMSREEFSYEEFEVIRSRLITTIHENLTKRDKDFLLGFKNVAPDWSVYNFEHFPSVKWKLQNLETLKKNNPEKHRKLYETLREKLFNR